MSRPLLRPLLIVDDDEVIRLLLESHFRTRGFRSPIWICPAWTASPSKRKKIEQEARRRGDERRENRLLSGRNILSL